MRSYLSLKAASYDLLVDTLWIREVLAEDRDGASATVSGHRVWRGEPVPVLDLARVLGGRDSTGLGAIVLQNDAGTPVFIDVDAIGRVYRLEDDAFRRLPPLPPAVVTLFDRLLVAGDGECGLLRLGDRGRDALVASAGSGAA